MRIISGKWRGRRLVAFKSDAIRPTTDRVKETIFNMIGPDIVGATVLDLFAGTGSLGFEALSRGAERVLAVDKGVDSKKIIEKNKNLIGIESGYEFRSDEIIRFLAKEKRQFDYIFVDPPFTLKMGAEVMRALDDSSVIKPGTRIFVEYVKGEEIPEEFTKLHLEKAKNYGDKLMYSYILKE